MAIIIPSKNIYDKQNPKIRDNVIDKLEIQSIAINTKIERNSTVFSYNGLGEDFTNGLPDTFVENYKEFKSTTENNALYNFDNFNDLYGNKASFEYNLGWIIIKSTYLKFYVDDIYSNAIVFSQLNKEKKIIQVENPEFSYNLTKKVGNVSSFDITYGDKSGETINNKVGSYFNSSKIDNIETNYGEKQTTTDKLGEKLSVQYTSQGYNNVSDATLSLTGTNKDNTSEAKMLLFIGDKVNLNFYYLNKTIYFLIGVEIITLTKNGYYSSTDWVNAFDITTAPQSETVFENFVSSCTKYEAENISIRIFGETISIIPNEKTLIVGNENGEKVHSIDGNELMQTSNYYQSTDTNAIKFLFTNTQSNYENGKETATIRCDISDYYEYNATANKFKGDKVIAIDNSTGKMSFKMNDQVIPMVYGSDGKDRPMSLYKNGLPKVFEIVGTNIYYDGAVWQELNLIEIPNVEQSASYRLVDMADYTLSELNEYYLYKLN